MGNFEKMARRLAEQYVRKGYENGNAELDEAATRILDATAPLTMADVKWDNEKHYLAGAINEIDGSECVMVAPIDGAIANASLGGSCLMLTSPGAFTPNGKKYRLVEVTDDGPEPSHPEVLVTLEDYEDAPVGTVVAMRVVADVWVKVGDKWKQGEFNHRSSGYLVGTERIVLRRGWGE